MKRGGALALLLVLGCASGQVVDDPARGLASWYGEELAGRSTANGEIFDPRGLTAAHRTLPFGTLVEVLNPANGRKVVVRINDRGPFVEGRIIDLSWAAATEIGMVEAGVAPVVLKVVGEGGPPDAPQPVVVRIEEPAVKFEIPRIPERPPAVAFPLPDTIGEPDLPVRPSANEPSGAVVDQVDVTVVRGGREVVRQVDPSGSRIEEVETGPVVVDEAGQRWVVQLGAFRDPANAEALRERASRFVSDVTTVSSETGLLVVRVGPWSSRVRAIEVRERLEAAGLETIVLRLAD